MKSRASRAVACIAAFGGLVLSLAAASPASAAAPAPPDGRWHVAWRADLPGGSTLTSVAAISTHDAWAVGVTVRHENNPGFAVHWNGAHWTLVRLHDPSFLPTDVAASSATNVWLTGSGPGGRPWARIWNGSKWRGLALPRHADETFPAVVLGARDVWVSEDSAWTPGHGWRAVVAHWTGSGWTSYTLPVGFTAGMGIAGSSAGNLWVAGTNSSQGLAAGTLVAYRWTGTSWQRVSAPAVRIYGTPSLDVSPSGAVWVEVSRSAAAYTRNAPSALRWRAGHWSELSTPSRPQLSWPPAADGLNGIWFGSSVYWTGKVLVRASLGIRGCRGGFIPPFAPDMSAIPGTHRVLWADGCAMRKNGKDQAVVMISGAGSQL